MQRSIAAALLLASTVMLGLATCQAQDTKETKKQPIATKQISSLMQLKLDKSKAILEGLAWRITRRSPRILGGCAC